MDSGPVGAAASQCILGPLSAQECAGNQHPQRIQCVPGPVIVQGWHHFPLFTDEKTEAEVGSSLTLPEPEFSQRLLEIGLPCQVIWL